MLSLVGLARRLRLSAIRKTFADASSLWHKIPIYWHMITGLGWQSRNPPLTHAHRRTPIAMGTSLSLFGVLVRTQLHPPSSASTDRPCTPKDVPPITIDGWSAVTPSRGGRTGIAHRVRHDYVAMAWPSSAAHVKPSLPPIIVDEVEVMCATASFAEFRNGDRQQNQCSAT